ncbi:MAG: glucoamylase family protein [Candidatus Korobacteraceae bacterium]
MIHGRYLEVISDNPGQLWDRSEPVQSNFSRLRAAAAKLSSSLITLPASSASRHLRKRCKLVQKTLLPLLPRLEMPAQLHAVSQDLRWLHEHVRLIDSLLHDLNDLPKSLTTTPHVETRGGIAVPRVIVIVENYLSQVRFRFREEEFAAYIDGFEENAGLQMHELWALVPVLKLVLLERIARLSPQLDAAEAEKHFGVAACVQSLCEIGETDWQKLLEPLVLFDKVLREDPAGVYAAMDFESREHYRSVVVDLAVRSGMSEMDVAIQVLTMAQAAEQLPCTDLRLTLRRSHVGYYLVAEGLEELHRRIGYQTTGKSRLRDFLYRHPNQYYLSGIALATTLSVCIVILLGGEDAPAALVALAIAALLVPCSQAAVELMNYLTSCLLPPRSLAKLDFSEGIPDDCITMVVVPTLLLNKKQVHSLVENLEVHYLANRDRNLHFALLTDLPDSATPPDENDPLVDLCVDLVQELNDKYSDQRSGSFFLLHRHRVFNPFEEVWMGWERKRGKLLDLNKLLRADYDSFPVKVGNAALLAGVRYVITLDSDTELPRHSAHRLAGTMAHPLNQAIIDPANNIVTKGYGILQPRVGISVNSAASSRLANIYSGQTGLDLYTRAISDVYQDLYNEGIFTGKGIYEVDAFQQVLDHRFPRNSLLSHDLIEGAYARAGLASDIEIIDDYPSHYSAFTRRKHRWLRGDWQIAEWLLPLVPNELGHHVPNPISLVSRWKIFDNIRRSLVEPATFLLLVLGWFVLPGTARFWTIATLGLLLAPSCFQLAVGLYRAVRSHKAVIAADAFSALASAVVNVWLSLTFLFHQTLVSLDAIVRTCVRRVVTRKRLLEWETAAQAELGSSRRTQLDRYLDWTPTLVLGLGALLAFVRPSVLPAALPLLTLWASSKLIPQWLNRPAGGDEGQISPHDELFLREAALRTWRYFATFGTKEHNWLVPDNVQEQPAAVAARVSPTNIGLLLNARQVACELGYLTVPEFARQTSQTIDTVLNLPRHRGHLLNWYSTRDLLPLTPRFVSTVDSGNLVASLWSLQQGSLEQLKRPLFSPALVDGLLDHVRSLWGAHQPSPEFLALERQVSAESWLEAVLRLPESFVDQVMPTDVQADVAWFALGAKERVAEVKNLVRKYAPWLLPEFAVLRQDAALQLPASKSLTPETLPDMIEFLAARLSSEFDSTPMSPERALLCQNLQGMLFQARKEALGLLRQLRNIAHQASVLADQMDFSFLLNRRRKLLSVGFDVESGTLHASCYDLLASEARMATFVAVAKEEIPQESWFLLGRAHAMSHGRPVLLSWTGTMFEYLMPSLWMRSYPNTLLERSRAGAVKVQQMYAAKHGIPWGISESAFCEFDAEGNYQYAPYGVPGLGLKKQESEVLVISPYSTLLALDVDVSEAVSNMRSMARLGWMGKYGYYEAADFTCSRHSGTNRYDLVACWMAHHQGMSLLALGNFLKDRVVQQWFHSNRYVQATELLLQEKPVAHVKRNRQQSAVA